MTETLPAITAPTHDTGPDVDRLANDPRLAAIAHVFAAAMIAALSPWLTRMDTAMKREAPILLSVDEARAYCGGLAKSTWSDFDQRGVIPAPVRIGGRVFWRRTDLDAWVAHNCPGRARFEECQAVANNPRATGKMAVSGGRNRLARPSTTR